MPSLIVRKQDGSLLFNTDYITYGLVKSGYLALAETWSRRYLRSANLDPNDGSNWSASTVAADGAGDRVWSFTLANAQSPIVFLTGSGTLNGTARSGNTMTFYYSNASTSTRFYCFDLMSDNIAGSPPYLKMRRQDGTLTFNSLQVPLNIVGAYTPPGPSALNTFGRYYYAYDGGYNRKRQYASGPAPSQMDCGYDINLDPNTEYAACLPWSRSATVMETNPSDGYTGPATQYNTVEGAFGRVGGISFLFGASAGTPQALPGGFNGIPASYSSIATDRIPQALVIKTANLPMPYR